VNRINRATRTVGAVRTSPHPTALGIVGHKQHAGPTQLPAIFSRID